MNTKNAIHYLLQAKVHFENWVFQELELIPCSLKLNLSSAQQPLQNQPNIWHIAAIRKNSDGSYWMHNGNLCFL